MKTLALLSAWVFLASAGIPNALASSAYTCTTVTEGSATADIGLIGINNKGQVIGTWSEHSQPQVHPFLRNPDGSTTPLVSPSGSDSFSPIGINNLGQILGANSDRTFFILNPDGSYTDIAPPVAPPGHTYDNFWFTGINDKGELAGSITEDTHDSGSTYLIIIRGTDGKDRIIDQDQGGTAPSIYSGPINNSGAVVERKRYVNGFLLQPNGSKMPLTFPGLPFESAFSQGVIFTTGLNNNNATVGYFGEAPLQDFFAYRHTPDGHAPAIVCPDVVNDLNAESINDQNVVVGNLEQPSPSGSGFHEVGFIATPTGVSPHVKLSNSNWAFDARPTGETSGLGRVFLSNSGPADLHIRTIYVGTTGQASDQVKSFSLRQSNCTVGPHFQPNTIPPGGSCVVEFVFTPEASGWQTAAIYIADDAPDGPQAIKVGGTGTGSMLQLSNTSWTFAAHPVGSPSGKGVIYAYNSGPQPISFGSTQIEPPGEFQLINNTCGSELQPYRACALTFYFIPETSGKRTATLNLNDNSTYGPIQIPLTGFGY